VAIRREKLKILFWISLVHATLKVEKTEAQILQRVWCPTVVSTAGKKEVKKRIYNCWRKLV
jgi:hypothetical protein